MVTAAFSFAIFEGEGCRFFLLIWLSVSFFHYETKVYDLLSHAIGGIGECDELNGNVGECAMFLWVYVSKLKTAQYD